MIYIAGRVSCDELPMQAPMATGTSVLRELAPAAEYPIPGPVVMDTEYATDRARDMLRQYLGSLHARAGRVALIEAPNAFVVGQGAVVTSQRLLITDTVTEFLAHDLPPDGFVQTEAGLSIASRQGRRLEGACLLVKRPWYNNYGHWLVDLLPILALARGSGVSIDHIIFGDTVVPALRAMMETAAEAMFPGTPYSFVADDEPVRVERLHYVSPVHVPPIGKHPSAIQQLHDYGLARMCGGAGGDRIFVSRRSGSRKIENGEETERFLARDGFRTIFPEDLTFAEQVATFHDADVVVGIKGAAMTNTAFCRPGTSILLLSPRDFPDPFFWDLVATRGVHYGELFCRTVDEDGHAAYIDFRVDVEKLGRALAAMTRR